MHDYEVLSFVDIKNTQNQNGSELHVGRELLFHHSLLSINFIGILYEVHPRNQMFIETRYKATCQHFPLM